LVDNFNGEFQAALKLGEFLNEIGEATTESRAKEQVL